MQLAPRDTDLSYNIPMGNYPKIGYYLRAREYKDRKNHEYKITREEFHGDLTPEAYKPRGHRFDEPDPDGEGGGSGRRSSTRCD